MIEAEHAHLHARLAEIDKATANLVSAIEAGTDPAVINPRLKVVAEVLGPRVGAHHRGHLPARHAGDASRRHREGRWPDLRHVSVTEPGHSPADDLGRSRDSRRGRRVCTSAQLSSAQLSSAQLSSAQLSSAQLSSAQRYDLLPRHLAAACLARANRLLCGIRDLADHGLSDVGGVLLRALLEFWMVGLYVLYGGREAAEHVGGAHVRSLMNLPPDAFPKVQAMVEEWEEFNLPANRINLKNLAPKLGDLLEAAGGTETRATVESYYEVLYRGSSLVDAHAELQTMLPHIVPRRERMDVTVMRRQHGDREALDLVTGAVLVGHLAWHVRREFGFSTAQIEQLIGQMPTADESSP